MGKFKDLTRQKFGRLLVIERAKNIKENTAWLCQCECGNQIVVRGDSLKQGKTKSCGCYQKEVVSESAKKHMTKHSMAKTRLNNIYHGMKGRCLNPNNHSYNYYGGRGIAICSEWIKDFRNFRDWALTNDYQDGLTLDRIDVNGNYEPSNCRWVTMKEQQNNRRNNYLIVYKGEVHTLSEWARIKKIKITTLKERLKKPNWNIEKALEFKTREY